MELPDKFPDCSSDDLKEYVRNESKRFSGGSYSPLDAQWRPNLIQLALAELQNRENRKSLKFARWALYVAAASLVFTTAFAYQNWKSDQNWQNSETQLLQKIDVDLQR